MGGTVSSAGGGDDPSRQAADDGRAAGPDGAARPPRGQLPPRVVAGALAAAAVIAVLGAIVRSGRQSTPATEASAVAPSAARRTEPSPTRTVEPISARESLQRAKEALVAGRFAEAMSGFDAAAGDAATSDDARKGRDDTVRAYLALAAAKEERGAHADAAAAYEAALAGVDPAHVADDIDVFDIRTRLADALIGAGHPPSARAALDGISDAQRDRPLAKALRAKCALAEAGGSEWPAGATDPLNKDALTAVGWKRLSGRFLDQSRRELRLGLAWEALLDAQVAAALAPMSLEQEYAVGAAFAARCAAGSARPGDDARARTWLTKFVVGVDTLGVGATAELTSRKDDAARILSTLPAGK